MNQARQTPAPVDRPLDWVLAGYGDAPWSGMLDSRSGRLFRLGIWWRRSGGATPVHALAIGERVVVINRHVLVVDAYGDVTSSFEFGAPPQSLASAFFSEQV